MTYWNSQASGNWRTLGPRCKIWFVMQCAILEGKDSKLSADSQKDSWLQNMWEVLQYVVFCQAVCLSAVPSILKCGQRGWRFYMSWRSQWNPLHSIRCGKGYKKLNTNVTFPWPFISLLGSQGLVIPICSFSEAHLQNLHPGYHWIRTLTSYHIPLSVPFGTLPASRITVLWLHTRIHGV
jgi:hypothetical protein